MPDPTPPTQNEPSPPPASPAPPTAPDPPAEPPKPSFRPLEDDLAEFAGGEPPKPPDDPKPPEGEPKPPEGESKPPEGEPKPPEGEPKPPETPEDDYLGVPKPKEEPKPPEKPEDPPTGPLKAPELRAEYAKVKQRLAEAEKELGSYKSGGKPVDDGEKKVYLEQIDTLKKQLEEATGHVKAVAYEQSDEYKQKYEKPFIDAWQDGAQQVTTFNVTDVEGNVRKGTPEDFTAIMQQPDNEQAANMAQEMFGANAFYVLAQRRDILKLHGQRTRALEEFRATLSEREKQALEMRQKQAQELEARKTQSVALFKQFNTQAVEKYPELFAPVPGDEEGNALLEKGYRDADLAFSGAPDMPHEKRVALHSAIRNRAAVFSRLVYQLKGKDSEIAALKAELEEIRGSTPGPGEVARGDKDPNRRPTADEEIEAAAMKNM